MATLTFKAGASWFTPNVTTVKRSIITAINIVDLYVTTGNEIDSWDASEDNDGSIMCYVTGTTLTIAGNGSGTIKFNADQSYWLYSIDGKDYFKNCTSFTGLSLIDTSNCTTLNRSFRGLEKITSLDIGHFDVSNVTSLYQTFCYCKKLTSLPIENWDVSNVTTMAYTFYQMGALTLPIENWNVSNVTNLDHTFAHSTSLNNLNLTKWDVSNVTNMNATFCGMKALTSLDLSTWDTSKVTCFPQFVEGCSNLEVIYGLENFDTSKSVCFAQMFRGCSKLKELDLSSFDTRNADSGTPTSDNGSTSGCTWQMITNTYNLEKITLGKYFTFEGKGVDIVPAEDIGTLPTPSATYIEEADGNWYTEDFTAYAPADVPNLTEMTYYASKKVVNDVIDTRVLNYKGLKYVLQSLNTVIDTSLDSIDLSGLETKEDAQAKYDELIENKADKDHTHSWDELENRPFGEMEAPTSVVSEKTYNNGDQLLFRIYNQYNGFAHEGVYKITIDNTDVYYHEKSGGPASIGDSNFTEYPFYAQYSTQSYPTYSYIYFQDGNPHVFKAELMEYQTVAIDEKYIPSEIARKTYVDREVAKKANSVHTHYWDDLEDKPFGLSIREFGGDDIPLTTITENGQVINKSININNGVPYVVRFDREYFECDIVLVGHPTDGTTYLGNLSLCGDGEDNGLPFCIKHPTTSSFVYVYVSDASVSHTIEATLGQLVTNRIDEKFIPYTIARKTYVDENFALKSDLENIDLSGFETKEDAQAKYDELVENKADKEHVHSWNDLEDKPFEDTLEQTELYKGSFVTKQNDGSTYNYSLPAESAFVFDKDQRIHCVMDGVSYEFGTCRIIVELPEEMGGGVEAGGYGVGNGKATAEYTKTEYEQMGVEGCNVYYEGEVDASCPFYILGAEVGEGFTVNANFIFFNETEPTEHTVEIYLVEGDFKQLDEKFIPDTISRTNHAHSYNDLKDKPFGEVEVTDVMLEDSVIESVTSPDVIGIDAEAYYVETPYNVEKEFKAGEEYAVIFDGKEYRCSVNEILVDEGRLIQLGNFSIGEPILNAMGIASFMDEINDDWTNNDCPFYLHCSQLYSDTVFPLTVVTNFDSTGSTFSIHHVATGIKKIDEDFLPEGLAKIEYIDEQIAIHNHSFNDLEDKPFGEVMSDIIDFEWDGDANRYNIYDISLPNGDEESFIRIAYVTPSNIDSTTVNVVKCDADGLWELNIPLSSFEIQDGYMFHCVDLLTGSPRFAAGYIFIVTTEEGAVASGFPSTGVYMSFEARDGIAQYYLKNIRISEVESVITIPEKYIPDTIARTEHVHFWNDLVDKPFYATEPIEVVIVEENTFEFENNGVSSGTNITLTQPLIGGQEYIIRLDGTAYNYVAKAHEESGVAYIGNLGMIGLGEDTGEQLVIVPMISETDLVFGINNDAINSDVPEHTLGITMVTSELRQLDEMFIPDSIARVSDIPEVDIEMSDDSENAVQNRVVKAYVDSALSSIEDGNIVVKESEHSANAEHAGISDEATKATQDANGNVIADTYETKVDAQTKYDEAIAYVDQVKSDIYGGIPAATLDTLTELAVAFEEHQEVSEALDAAITQKADVEHTHFYNDLTDKPFGEVETTEAVLEETVLNKFNSFGVDLLISMHFDVSISSVLDKTKEYVVTFDGMDYVCKIGIVDEGTEDEMIVIGNHSFAINPDYIDGSYSNPDCPIWLGYANERLTILTNFDATGSTLSIHHVTKELKQLDEEFIPDTIARTEYVNAQLVTKANEEHTHAISDVTNLQSTLDAKASQADLDAHVADATAHITATERTNWNAAKTHADSDHAPSNAQENVIESIKVNGTAQAITSKSVDITVPTEAADIGAAPATHNHAISEITDLQTTLNNAASAIQTNTNSISAHTDRIVALEEKVGDGFEEITSEEIRNLFNN